MLWRLIDRSDVIVAAGTTPAGDRNPVPSARYMADMVAADGKKMTIGISVDGSDIAAYACNGTDDEAWFFGNQTDGKVDIKSRFRDTLQAEFDGNEVTGEVTMNEVEYDFTATPVSGVAGMYTADYEGVRASWVVRPDGSATGVQFTGGFSGRDFERPNCSNSTSCSSATASATSANSAGGADRVPAEQERKSTHQRHGRDSDAGDRHLPLAAE